MALIRGRQRNTSAQIFTASMADIAFLLIIFFMLTGTFKRVGELQLSLPEAETAAPAAGPRPRCCRRWG